MSQRDRTIRFGEKVDVRAPGCWEWAGWRNHNGYGVLATGPQGGQKRELAHRVSWEINVGPIPDGLGVLHHCDNPPCVRPDHLFVGTQQDNVDDMVAKGRALTGARNPATSLTPDVVAAIRASTDTIRSAGARFGVSYSTIARIRRGDTWAAG